MTMTYSPAEYRAARNLVETLFGGFHTPAWREAVELLDCYMRPEDLVWERAENMDLNPTENMVDYVAAWLLETAAELDDREDTDGLWTDEERAFAAELNEESKRLPEAPDANTVDFSKCRDADGRVVAERVPFSVRKVECPVCFGLGAREVWDDECGASWFDCSECDATGTVPTLARWFQNRSGTWQVFIADSDFGSRA